MTFDEWWEAEDMGNCYSSSQAKRRFAMAYDAGNKHSTSATLRDQFAMAAILPVSIGVDKEFTNTIAEHAYKIADAMLKVREGKCQ